MNISKGESFQKETPREVFLAPVPKVLFSVFFVFSFVLPNLVFSGSFFYSTLHLMKWATAVVPLALCGIIAGYRILTKGTVRTSFRVDGFAVIWLVLLFYMTVQPFWSGVRSFETFFQEWFFFASLWLVYILAVPQAGGRLLRILLWGALVNCAVSVVFAEAQVRGFSNLFFFILPTPGHYIANTGQQNMLALWLALGGVNGAFLFFSGSDERKKNIFLALPLLAVTFWGLISTTSRSGILAFLVGFAVLSSYFLRNFGRENLRKILAVSLLFCVVLGFNLLLNEGRWDSLVNKMDNIVENPLSIANRDSIWATSWTMYMEHLFKGVGLGQYKWHYLDAQREMLQRWPRMKWQYTYWAHNEFLQWFAEAGTAGGLIMVFLWGWWAFSAFTVFLRKKQYSPEAFWGSAAVALFLFNALWTRPFHRIENALWLSLAFAVTNREILFPLFPTLFPEDFQKGGRFLAGVVVLVSFVGLVYFGNGVWGDRMLLLAAENKQFPLVQRVYLEKAFSSPMVKETAEKQLAYYMISFGEHRKDPEALSEGLNRLMGYFRKQPHVQELDFLKEWSRRLNNMPLYEEFASYGRRPVSK